jgi:uncharacterized membrane protein YvbJ
MIYCNECGEELEDTAKFCSRCGKALLEAKNVLTAYSQLITMIKRIFIEGNIVRR